MTEIGPHLLGRLPSPPDERDYKLVDYLAANPLDAALAVLLNSHAAKATKDYIRIAHPFIRALMPPDPGPTPSPPPSAAVLWADADADLDQGDFGTCVGNGWAQWGNTQPVDDHFNELDARVIYYEATVIDGQPDNPDSPGGGQQGSTVRSGAKAMANRKRLSAYAFAASLDEAVAWVLAHGPVVMGTDWLEAMFTTDADGFVVPTGAVAGGHCYVLVGYDPASEVLTFLNSWGSSWGSNGRFYMHKADAEKLFASQGEACAAVELP